MAHLSLGLLGALQIERDGQPVTGFESIKVRALLAYLAVEADRPHRREVLAGVLWPDVPDHVARPNLRQALANLREAIGDASAMPPFLLITRDSVQFNPASDYDMDVATFGALLAACESHAHRRLERCRSCAVRMQKAISLYRGDFLAEFALGDSALFEEWQLRHRERLHQRALDALTYLADYHERRGEDEPARRYAQRQIELDPWREEAHRQLMRLLACGGQRSAALAQYETCRRILLRDLDVAPAAETTALYEQIRDQQTRRQGDKATTARENVQPFSLSPPLLVSTSSRHNIPAQPTPLIGRESELAELGALLENPACRLIAIVGPGGIGKTRVALAAATEQAETFTHGAVFVPLAGISSAAFLAPAILSALDVALQGQRDPREQLLDYLREKELLLVLDNVEQLLVPDESQDDDAVTLLADILAHAPGVTLLVTSRERLALPGEWLFDLSGLSYPAGETVNGVEDYSAVRLFMQRAGQVRRHFLLAHEEGRAVARICRLVEGLPLAIELAAAALRTRSCTAIAAAIENNLSVLAIELRAVPERQRSIRATFEHSWRLLSDDERRILARLSVFRGGFEEHAADQVSQASLQLLAALVDKSLLRWDGTARYDMHELVRQYASAKLGEAGEAGEIRKQHAAYYLALAETAEPELTGAQQVAWLDRLERNHDNLRAALSWALERGEQELAARLGAALWRFGEIHGHVSEGRAWMEQVLAGGNGLPVPVQAKALLAAGAMAWVQSSYERAQELCTGSLALYREMRNIAGISISLTILGWMALARGGFEPAKPLAEENLALCREEGYKQGIAGALHLMAYIRWRQGDLIAARALSQELLRLRRELADIGGIADALWMLGWVAQLQGDLTRAIPLFEESLALCRELGSKGGISDALNGLGEVARLQGDYQRARVFYEQSLALRRERGDRRGSSAILDNLGRVALAQGDIAQATALFKEDIALCRDVEYKDGIAQGFQQLGYVAAAAVLAGEAERAVQLLGAAEALHESIGYVSDPDQRVVLDRTVERVRAQLGEEAFVAAWEAGRAMTLEQAIAYALEVSAGDAEKPAQAAATSKNSQ